MVGLSYISEGLFTSKLEDSIPSLWLCSFCLLLVPFLCLGFYFCLSPFLLGFCVLYVRRYDYEIRVQEDSKGGERLRMDEPGPAKMEPVVEIW